MTGVALTLNYVNVYMSSLSGQHHLAASHHRQPHHHHIIPTPIPTPTPKKTKQKTHVFGLNFIKMPRKFIKKKHPALVYVARYKYLLYCGKVWSQHGWCIETHEKFIALFVVFFLLLHCTTLLYFCVCSTLFSMFIHLDFQRQILQIIFLLFLMHFFFFFASERIWVYKLILRRTHCSFPHVKKKYRTNQIKKKKSIAFVMAWKLMHRRHKKNSNTFQTRVQGTATITTTRTCKKSQSECECIRISSLFSDVFVLFLLLLHKHSKHFKAILIAYCLTLTSVQWCCFFFSLFTFFIFNFFCILVASSM